MSGTAVILSADQVRARRPERSGAAALAARLRKTEPGCVAPSSDRGLVRCAAGVPDPAPPATSGRRSALVLPLLAAVLVLTACRSAYYSAWEKLGKEKRDLLRDSVTTARDEQGRANEQFKDALQRLQELYGKQGSELEAVYERVKSDHDRSVARAGDVRSRVDRVEQVAKDLFREWEKEAAQISDASMRAESRDKLRQTKGRYETLHAAMKRAEKSMDPVLTRFRDQVLYLKHNLNAQALGTLQGEAARIELDVKRLNEDMAAAIAEAERFLASLS
jgi:hypothetical protein